jgi:2-polyprenyl-3-methyl-5-hydroxy-6-metoxy-1,4-benzoquinol methylase
MNDQNNYIAAFSWQTSDPPSSHQILEPIILDICARLRILKVLDFGCGNGSLSRSLHGAGMQVTGCDVDAGGIEIASACAEDIRYVLLQGYEDPAKLQDNNFDAVVSTEVIEHLFFPRYLLRFARTVLKPGGYVIISTPYHGYLKNLALSLVNKWDFHHGALNDGGHIKFWSRKTLTQLLRGEGFQITGFYGAGRCRYFWKSMIIVAQYCSATNQ